MTPANDPAARAAAEALDHAHFAARRSAAGMRLCEERNRERLPAGWWIIPGALLGLGMVAVIVWWLS